jgi:wyosine [tRNA(Phe)-imidazoG37] synthetase (radical SAM superfamily)
MSEDHPKKHVFGPVPSRRLGRSLGVDLVPFKTCSYNCVYCQLGRTTCLTTERKEWAPAEDVLQQVKLKLSGQTQPDFITFSGSGEPTLHSRIGEIIRHIKKTTDIPVAVLTNGSLLWQPEVRESLLPADVVMPSLDAGDESLFRCVNRPHPSVSFDLMLAGLRSFREEYRGQYSLEVFLLRGVTGIEVETRKIAAIVEQLRPDRVHLNTVARPPAEDFALAVPRERMAQLCVLFGRRAEVIGEESRIREHVDLAARRDDVLSLLQRRPCTADDIAEGLGMERRDVMKYLGGLLSEGSVTQRKQDTQTYYLAAGKGTIG